MNNTDRITCIVSHTLTLKNKNVLGNVENEENTDVLMTKETSTMIKGGLALCILLHHILEFVGNSDTVYPIHIGYLLVAAFFWISGYGVRKSLQKKERYLDGFLAKSISKLYFPFLAVSAVYIGVRYCFGITYSIEMILVSMIGVRTIASFSWFVFEIIALYIAFYIAFEISKKHGEIVVFFITLMFVWFAYQKEMDTYWYVSTLAFPFGIVTAARETFFCNYIFKSKKIKYVCIIFLIVTTVGASKGAFPSVLCAVISSLFACLAVGFIAFNMGEKKSKLLHFWGQNSYELYLMQGLFVRGFKEIVVITNDLVYAVVAIAFSLSAALIFKYILKNTRQIILGY